MNEEITRIDKLTTLSPKLSKENANKLAKNIFVPYILPKLPIDDAINTDKKS